jgi:acid stress-induced BolA-like protein IbaG/YrbA
MFNPKDIEEAIAEKIDCAHLAVEGDGMHFEALIVSPDFSGLGLLARHRLVYEALGDELGEAIHALSLKTYAPEEWNKENI